MPTSEVLFTNMGTATRSYPPGRTLARPYQNDKRRIRSERHATRIRKPTQLFQELIGWFIYQTTMLINLFGTTMIPFRLFAAQGLFLFSDFPAPFFLVRLQEFRRGI